MENLQTVKQRFGIIGNDVQLTRALEKAVRVSPTDISVLVTGESGVGKESAVQSLKELLIVNFLAMKKVHLQVLQHLVKDILK
jgi:transcriptional regulator of acetoin/glycerol metabolism